MNTPTTLTLQSTVVSSKQQISSELAGEQVILDLHRGIYHGLNASGARVWQLIQKPLVVAEVRDTLLREYDVDAAQCESDLLALLRDLANKGLVEVQRSAGE